MAHIILISSSRVRFPLYNHQNPKTKHFFNTKNPSTINLNLKTSSFSISRQIPSTLKILKIKCSCYRQPITPFSVIAPVLHAIRDFTASRFFNGGFSSRNPRDFRNCVRSGGIGTALLSTTMMAKGHISPFVTTLSANPTFVSGLCAWAMAQSLKVFLNFFVERRWDFRILFASGGMPSSHSALCTALSTSVALCHGIRDSLFPVCLGFSLIVMYDAIGVRRHAGMHAEVLNMIVEDLFQGHPISQRKLKELLGHTPSQVFAGALLGFLVACICCQGCLVAV